MQLHAKCSFSINVPVDRMEILEEMLQANGKISRNHLINLAIDHFIKEVDAGNIRNIA